MRALADDELVAAIEQAYRDGYRRFLQLGVAMLGDVDRGRDAVQEAFARALRSRGDLRRLEHLQAWLWRTLVNICKAEHRHPVARLDQTYDAEANGHANEWFELRAVLAALPERQRLVPESQRGDHGGEAVNDRDITAVLDRLVEKLDDEVGDWDDVLERAARPAPAVVRRRLRSRGRLWQHKRSLLFAGAAAVVAALVALTVTSPWRGGPSILDRAAAGVLNPTSGQVLYDNIELRPTDQGSPIPVRMHVHVWLDGAPPHRFRVTFQSTLPDSVPVEVGGRLGRGAGLSYSTSDDVLDPTAFLVSVTQSRLDPAAFVRSALTSGRAKVEGKTRIRGREALRIRLSARVYGPLIPIAYFYTDAHTYRPVRVVITAESLPFIERARLPLACITSLFFYSCGAFRGWVYDFLEYRYLAPTAANRKLTDIRAMHPRADIV